MYSKNDYVAAVGYGDDRGIAEKNALAALTGVFGQSIKAELDVVIGYSESVSRSGGTVSQNSSVQSAIKIITALDSLVGAQIGDVWYDGKRTHYAVAVMEKTKTAALYADMIQSHQRIITDLVTMSDADKGTLDGYARYQLAAVIADANQAYTNVLTIVGSSAGIVPEDLKSGTYYRREATEMVKNIPIGVAVTNDRSNRIQSAFAAVINKAGFKSGGTSGRYVLKVQVTLDPVDNPNQSNKFVRYVVVANLMDTTENSVLLPFSINGREGHLSISEAENRAIMAAEKKINESYGGELSGYFLALLSKQ
jgi:hypothetical protein